MMISILGAQLPTWSRTEYITHHLAGLSPDDRFPFVHLRHLQITALSGKAILTFTLQELSPLTIMFKKRASKQEKKNLPLTKMLLTVLHLKAFVLPLSFLELSPLFL